MEFTGDFNKHSEAMRRRREAQDFDDLQDAIAGRQVGRHRKRIHTGDIDPLTGQRRKSASEIARETLEWLLANNPDYARVHSQAMDTLRGAEQTAQTALQRVLAALEAERAALNEILDRAAKLPDGTRVFRDADGVVWTEHGKRVDAETAAKIEWRGSEPSYENYTAQRARVEELKAAERELRGIEIELGGLRDEINTNESPATIERVDSVIDQAGELEERATEIEACVLKKAVGHETRTANEASYDNDASASELAKKPVIEVGKNP